MTLIKRNPSKPANKKTHSRYAYIAPACRRCGDPDCICSEDDIDSGGPANP